MYASASGRRPVREFLNRLSDEDAAEVAAAMADVRQHGLKEARHLRGEVYEVRAVAERAAYRVLFASEGREGQVLLALEAFSKTTQRTPTRLSDLAQRRLADWRRRGRHED